MFACCDLCYVQYINEDGSIDYEPIFKAIEERTTEIIKESRQRLKEGKGLKTRGVPSYSFNPNKLCKCKCHIKGTQVMH